MTVFIENVYSSTAAKFKLCVRKGGLLVTICNLNLQSNQATNVC